MALTHCKPALACPSLYSTIRLAHLVQHIRDKLKASIQKYDGPKGSAPYSHHRRQSIHAAKEVIHSVAPCEGLTDPSRRRRGSRQLLTSELGCIDLLRDVDSRTPFGGLSLCKNAAHDSLFLRHNFRLITNAKTLIPLHRVLDLTTALLRRMKCLRQTLLEEGHNDYSLFGLDFDDIISDRFYANLEHLLRCLRQMALDAIVCLCLSVFVTDLFRWNHHQRDADEWFAEWPNAQHPLNTTWPWNVKTTLLVLWGVCWMFYANGGAGAPFNGSQTSSYGQNFRTRQTARQPPPQNTPLQAPAALATPQTFPHFPYLHPAQVGTLSRRASEHDPATALQVTQATYPTSVSTFPYITPSPYVSSDLFPASTVAWPYAPGSHSPSISVNTATSTAWQPSSSLPIPFTETPQSIESFSPIDTYAARRGRPQYHQQLHTPTTQSTGSTLSSLGFSLPLELQTDMQNYPSPQYSDVSGPTFTAHHKMMQGSNVSPRIPVAASPSLARSSESRQSSLRSLEPTRNADGVLYCNHPEHGYSAPTFARKCEWSKHMDRHTRPYTCEEPGCENRGFTYSGGLHRHQREVHRQHGGPKAKCMCPHQDCKRSTGLGFSRRENLLEHLRRVHLDVPPKNKDNTGGEQFPKASESRKRRRRDDEEEDDDKNRAPEDYAEQSPQTLKQEVKKLRRELQESSERVRRLEQKMEQINKTQKKL